MTSPLPDIPDAAVEAACAAVIAEWKATIVEFADLATPGDIARDFVSPGNHRLLRAALTAITGGK